MAGIQERKDRDGKVTYRVQVRIKGYPHQRATFERKTDAKRWAQQTESAIREGRHFKTTEAKKHTFGDLVDRYINNVLPRLALKTEKDRKRHLLWWKDKIGSYTLADITTSLIMQNRDFLLSEITCRGVKRSPSTVNRYISAISHAFTIATNEWEWVDNNPLSRISKLKEPRGRIRFLIEDERDRLLEACKERSQVLYTIVVIAISTGARKNEILTIKWKDVNLEQGMMTFHETKNNEIRTVPLQGQALDLVKDMSKVRRIDTDLIFPSKANNQNPIDFRKDWEAVLKQAEIEDFKFHDLRHTAASYLAMNGATTAEIAEVLGHKTLQMVKRYSHLSESHTTEVVASMNNKIFGV